MNAGVETLRTELLEAGRAELVIELLDSLDDRPVEDDQAEFERVWAEETARRATQIESGAVVTDSWDDVMATAAASRRGR
jgi:hypothetical protein